ncbi:MAG: ATP-binding protein [Oscillospiraceae bacterium]|nr:ATP-binding protein [Oscillospiraceae bacterium]
MSYPAKIYELADQELFRRRTEALTRFEENRAEAEKKVPELAELARQESELVCRGAVAILRGDRESSAARLEDQLAELRRMRAEMLSAAGLPADYLEIPYHCPLCEDRGRIGSEFCGCARELHGKLACQELNRSSGLRLMDFSDFRLDYYPDAKDKSGKSVRNVMESVFQYCLAYAQEFSMDCPSLLLYGETGLGKTHLSLAIAKAVSASGYQVSYVSAPDWFHRLSEEHFSSSQEDSLSPALSCDLLIIDDLGAEFVSSFTQSCLYNVINSRILSGKPFLLNTNLSAAQMTELYGDRIVSRIIGACDALRFVGNDIRQIKKREE